jgi:hypothetical protein
MNKPVIYEIGKEETMSADAVGHVIAVIYVPLTEALAILGQPVEPLASYLITAALQDGGPPDALAILETLTLPELEPDPSALPVYWASAMNAAAA